MQRKKLLEFRSVRSLFVMFFLQIDVLLNGIHSRLRDSERTVAILPNEFIGDEIVVVDEMGTAAFDVLDDLGDAQIRWHAKQAMDVVGDAVYDAEGATQTLEFDTDELVQAALQARMNEWFSVFCGPYGMDPNFCM